MGRTRAGSQPRSGGPRGLSEGPCRSSARTHGCRGVSRGGGSISPRFRNPASQWSLDAPSRYSPREQVSPHDAMRNHIAEMRKIDQSHEAARYHTSEMHKVNPMQPLLGVTLVVHEKAKHCYRWIDEVGWLDEEPKQGFETRNPKLIVREHSADLKKAWVGAKSFRQLKGLLHRKYGTLVTGWRFALCSDRSGLVTYNEFGPRVRRLGYAGSIKELWMEIDVANKGQICLMDMAPEDAELLESFKRNITRNFLTAEGCWRHMSPQGLAALRPDAFVDACQNIDWPASESQCRLMHRFLDSSNGSKLVTVNDIEWLGTFQTGVVWDDGEGETSPAATRDSLDARRLDVARNLADAVMRICDSGVSNGVITRTDITAYLKEGTPGGRRYGFIEHWLAGRRWRRFKEYDTSGDGSLDYEELLHAMEDFVIDDDNFGIAERMLAQEAAYGPICAPKSPRGLATGAGLATRSTSRLREKEQSIDPELQEVLEAGVRLSLGDVRFPVNDLAAYLNGSLGNRRVAFMDWLRQEYLIDQGGLISLAELRTAVAAFRRRPTTPQVDPLATSAESELWELTASIENGTSADFTASTATLAGSPSGGVSTGTLAAAGDTTLAQSDILDDTDRSAF
eukprot:TRINITY_DN62569_c0_g1_i1.p1 TRINITY_DN62569_c0_g1~~TRINITY_DN62569_c0_g1_i1.p1  ORF type:complete len:624 (-),score=66.19 TRINITY_DN62569_c0_g1_i1:33-1904(-)